MIPKHDCAHYLGDRPCGHGRLCEGCPHYERPEGRALLIKTAAVGDVLRTTSLPAALLKSRPGTSLTWLTSAEAAPLLEGNPEIARVMKVHPFTFQALAPVEFDLIINLDKEPECCGLATALRAREKAGMLLSDAGTPVPADARSEYYFSLGLSDELKFRGNRKSYHRLIAEAAGLEYGGEKPRLCLKPREEEYGVCVVRRSAGQGGAVIGVNTGAGGSFAPKMAGTKRIAGLARALRERLPGASVLLLGGPDEAAKNAEIAALAGGAAVDAGCGHSIRNFAGIISRLDCLITGDTLALHIATALGVPAVAMFGPTCEQEIDLFGAGVKIVSPAGCAPCYRRECEIEPYCMDMISGDAAAEAAAALTKSK